MNAGTNFALWIRDGQAAILMDDGYPPLSYGRIIDWRRVASGSRDAMHAAKRLMGVM